MKQYEILFGLNLCVAAVGLAVGNYVTPVINIIIAGLMWLCWYWEETGD